MVRLRRRLHEGAAPLLGEAVRVGRLHLATHLVALVAHQHDGDAVDVALDVADLGEDRLQFLERLPARDRVDEYEGVPLRDRQALHGGELVAAGRVGDLQRAHLLVAADHLPVRVLDRRDVALAERAAHEAQHQRALANAARAEHHDAVVVTLFRHGAQPNRAVVGRLKQTDSEVEGEAAAAGYIERAAGGGAALAGPLPRTRRHTHTSDIHPPPLIRSPDHRCLRLYD